MGYRVHDGIVLAEICGRFFLIATTDAWKDCPKRMEINEYAAFCWRYFENQADRDRLVREIVKEYGTEEEAAASILDDFVIQLKEKNYLL